MMKIVNSIRNIYQDKLPIIESLQKDVDLLIGNNKKKTWHYFSRIKELESFALKLETGRVQSPSKMEDFFAATLVVENLKELDKAIQLVSKFFNIRYQRPKNIEFTHKGSESFPFDDLRLYVNYKEESSRPSVEFDNIIFEIQIKTFLQHAWAIATHDLVYKSDNISWAKERVAYQIKAMLEQAEVSISAAESIINVPELNKTNLQSKELTKIKLEIVGLWNDDDLPKDKIRLSKNIQDLLRAIDFPVEKMKELLASHTANGKGTHIKSLSPFAIMIQALLDEYPSVFNNLAHSMNNKVKYKLFVPSELDKFPHTEESKKYVICS